MYGRRNGACFRCGRFGHFARECFGSLSSGGGGGSAGPFGGSSSTVGPPPAPAPPPPPKPDAKKTKIWTCPPHDTVISERNDRELRTLLKQMWPCMPELVRMIFSRFGEQSNLPTEVVDPSFLDSIPLLGDLRALVELEFQLGRRAEAHFTEPGGAKRKEFIINPLDDKVDAEWRCHKVTECDLQLFAGDTDIHDYRRGWWQQNGSRMGIPSTLHRLSGISARQGELIGVVVRVGRTVTGIVERMLPEELRRSPESVLLVGPPNSGKTTVLREFARLLSDQDNRVVVVVDKTSEIAGASNVPHPAIGASCRWMPVDDPVNQHKFMRKAVENLSPDTIMVDEISTESECESAKTISQRGVQLIATVHGRSMTELVNDEGRSSLLGGVKSVTLSKMEVDSRVARGGGGEKQVMMRKYEPLFGTVIELHNRDLWYVHTTPKETVDAYLRREPVIAWRSTPGKFEQVLATPTEEGFKYEPELPAAQLASTKGPPPRSMRNKGSDLEQIQRKIAQQAPELLKPTLPVGGTEAVGAYAAKMPEQPWRPETPETLHLAPETGFAHPTALLTAGGARFRSPH